MTHLNLIEVLICLAISSIVLFFALPFTPSLYKKNQLDIIEPDIINAIRFAKTQSLMTGDNLLLTPLSGANDWSRGMSLFVDNPQHHYSPGVKQLREWHWQARGVQIAWRGFQSTNYLRFATDISHSAINGYFIIENNANQHVKLIAVSK